MNNYFYCYSYRLMYFVKANGINYIKYDFNPKNNLKFFIFEKNEQLDTGLTEWTKLKERNISDGL